MQITGWNTWNGVYSFSITSDAEHEGAILCVTGTSGGYSIRLPLEELKVLYKCVGQLIEEHDE